MTTGEKIGISLGVIGLLGMAYFVYTKSFGKPTDSQLKNLVDTANKTGWDVFEGVSFDKIKATFGQLKSSEVKRLTELASKHEKDMDAIEKTEASRLIALARALEKK